MTAAELITVLAKLPPGAEVCYVAGDNKGPMLVASQVDMVDVAGGADGYYAAIGVYGERKVAVVT